MNVKTEFKNCKDGDSRSRTCRDKSEPKINADEEVFFFFRPVKLLTKEKSLKLHKLSYAKKCLKFACQSCQKNFSRGSHLAKHIERNHNPDFRKQCLLCDKTFAGDRNLRVHIDTVHTSNPAKTRYSFILKNSSILCCCRNKMSTV